MMPARDGKPPREKGVLSFENEKKELVLNTTNYKYLCAEISRHPGEWVGAEIGLYVTDTSFGGRPEKGIRVKLLKLPEGIASTKAARLLPTLIWTTKSLLNEGARAREAGQKWPALSLLTISPRKCGPLFNHNEFQMVTVFGGSGGYTAQAARTGPLADPGERQASAD